MSRLGLPLLTTPLLKIPLLAGYAWCTYYGRTPPRAAAPKQEHRIVGANPDFLSTRFAPIFRVCTLIIKYISSGIAVVEAAAILAHHYPTSAFGGVIARVLPVPSTLRITTTSALACLLGIAGGSLRVWCYRALGRLFTFQVTVFKNHELVMTGPYAFVRHPSYTGFALTVAGIIVLLTSAGSYYTEAGLWESTAGRAVGAAIIVQQSWILVGLLQRMGLEDGLMREVFGALWDAWARRTPYRLIPFVY